MQTPIVFIITHEELGTALLGAVEKIMGSQKDVFVVSNSRDSLAKLMTEAGTQITAAGERDVIVFVDLVGGSCWALGNMLKKQFPHIAVVAGVNLPMLVTFFTNADRMDFSELVVKVAHDAKRGIISLE